MPVRSAGLSGTSESNDGMLLSKVRQHFLAMQGGVHDRPVEILRAIERIEQRVLLIHGICAQPTEFLPH